MLNNTSEEEIVFEKGRGGRGDWKKWIHIYFSLFIFRKRYKGKNIKYVEFKAGLGSSKEWKAE